MFNSNIPKLALTPISDFFLFSKIAIIWQIDGAAYKLKPRSFHKSICLQAYLTDFHSQCELHLTVLSDSQVCCHFWAVLSAKSSVTVLSANNLHISKSKIASSDHDCSILTLVPPLGTPFNTISCFSDHLAYLPNALQYSKWIHQRGHSSPRSPSSTVYPGWIVSPVPGPSIISTDNDSN